METSSVHQVHEKHIHCDCDKQLDSVHISHSFERMMHDKPVFDDVSLQNEIKVCDIGENEILSTISSDLSVNKSDRHTDFVIQPHTLLEKLEVCMSKDKASKESDLKDKEWFELLASIEKSLLDLRSVQVQVLFLRLFLFLCWSADFLYVRFIKI